MNLVIEAADLQLWCLSSLSVLWLPEADRHLDLGRFEERREKREREKGKQKRRERTEQNRTRTDKNQIKAEYDTRARRYQSRYELTINALPSSSANNRGPERPSAVTPTTNYSSRG
jgi:hypothetical protein